MAMIKLQIKKNFSPDIVVLTKDTTIVNQSDDSFYLLTNPDIIRKDEKVDTPEFIVLLGDNDKFEGLYKRIQADSDNASASCWNKVY